jgi:hypothetical protein
MANSPAPITKKILLSSALGGASSVEPTTTAENPIITAKARMIQKPFAGSLFFIFFRSGRGGGRRTSRYAPRNDPATPKCGNSERVDAFPGVATRRAPS